MQRDANHPLVIVVIAATTVAAVVAVIVVVGDGNTSAQRQQAEQGNGAGEHPRAIHDSCAHWSTSFRPCVPLWSFVTRPPSHTAARARRKQHVREINDRKAREF